MSKWKIRFPCGLEYVEKGIFCMPEDNMTDLRVLYEKGCPIHGKECYSYPIDRYKYPFFSNFKSNKKGGKR